ncbi:gamma-carboxyglutamic acid protein 3 isoform X2 [Ciona intestinalis]
MAKGVFVFALIIAYAGSALAAGGVFVSKEEASNYLTREKRANSGFEEFAQGNFEQECIEEVCNYEELREVYENTAQTNAKWDELTRVCENTTPCNDTGTDTCENLWRSYACHCHAGYTGVHCETDIDECQQDDTCVHGICINGFGTYDCVCSTGFEGDTCNDDINECENFDNLCQNEGECINDVGSYHCACAAGWTGSECSQDVNECDLNLCPEGSECLHGANSYTCFCPDEGCGSSADTQMQQASDP